MIPARLRAGPTANLAHLPVSLDLRAVNLAEGVRAALAVAALVALNEWADVPALGEAALAALLTCLCDAGGPLHRRLPPLLAFAALGAALTVGFGLLRATGLVLVIPATCLLIFCTSFARVWGQSALQVGNLLTVVTLLALDRPLAPDEALLLGGMFLAGSLWALLLTMVIWRLHPYRPSRRAVAEVFRRLAVLAGDLSSLLDPTGRDVGKAWADHARAHRRHVRDGIEQARTLVLDTVRIRGPGSARARHMLIQVEAADQVFGAMIGLSDVLEQGDPAAAAAARQWLPALRLLLAATADATAADEPPDDAARRALTERLLRQICGEGAGPALGGLAAAIADRLRVATLLTTPEGGEAAGESGAPAAAPQAGPARLLAPLRANLRWESASLRHGVRAAAVAAPALAITLTSGATYAHWLTITLVLTLQPFFALTWQRAVERIGGTVLGGVAAAGVAALVHTPLASAAVLFPLAVLAFTVRAVSFGVFQACLTPLIVLLSELGRPGESEFVIAAWRAGYTVLGGLLAVAGGALLWPSWEPGRVRAELRTAIRAHAAYADLEWAALLGEVPAGNGKLETARRGAGLGTNNLEASLARALQEPRHTARAGLEQAMVADAALRRIAGRLSALQHEPGLAGAADLTAWRQWLAQAFRALEAGAPLPPGPPADGGADPANGSLARIARQIELIDGALRSAPP